MSEHNEWLVWWLITRLVLISQVCAPVVKPLQGLSTDGRRRVGVGSASQSSGLGGTSPVDIV